MDQPRCDVIGCTLAAEWRRLVSSLPTASEEYLCDRHYTEICLHSPANVRLYEKMMEPPAVAPTVTTGPQ